HGTGPDAAMLLEEAGIRQSLANLRTFPFVAEREAAGKLSLHGCHFSIFKGQLFLLDEAEESFHPA
ncbi:MAG: carbonic anhydrase, partial [Pseudomonadota bacterium]|nr:carbonic anhydrase [Pseudomonadota bacterium]